MPWMQITVGSAPPLSSEMVWLNGTNFGAPGTPAVATYGGSATPESFAAVCTVVSHTRARCESAPGSGAAHRWSLVVGAQPSAPSTSTTSYAPPVIAAVEAPLLSTSGGDVTISGSNFGTGSGFWLYPTPRFPNTG